MSGAATRLELGVAAEDSTVRPSYRLLQAFTLKAIHQARLCPGCTVPGFHASASHFAWICWAEIVVEACFFDDVELAFNPINVFFLIH